MFRRSSLVFVTAALAIAVGVTTFGQAKPPAVVPATFVPDWTFTGSTLSSMRPVGQATWRAENGEIVGTPTSADGGWLLLSPGYQDVLFAGSFRCAAACSAGVMLRTENTSGGTKGIFTSLAGPAAAVAVTLDAQ